MKVLVIGSGGREHAVAWKLAQSADVTEVLLAPGNAGTAQIGKIKNIPYAIKTANDIPNLYQYVCDEGIALTVVGPELPLQLGIVDYFQEHGKLCFGPTQAAAQLETSKKFCKDFLARHHIPTAQYHSFNNLADAQNYLQHCTYPQVLKADGLAAGKGVVIAASREEALTALPNLLQINQCVVVEEFLVGEEASFIVVTDGETVVPLASAQDHKRRDEGDVGPNTGGMGAYSPAPVLTAAIQQRALTEIIYPTLAGMREEGHLYQGFLYAGLMLCADGPKLLEYNCRLGDPETQAILPRMQSDMFHLCMSALKGDLAQYHISWDESVSVTVVMCAAGYPEQYPTGEVISGLSEIPAELAWVFHAGTRLVDQQIVTAGGRVLAVTALGENLQQAQEKAYAAVQTIHWTHQYYRRDIAHRGLKHVMQDA